MSKEFPAYFGKGGRLTSIGMSFIGSAAGVEAGATPLSESGFGPVLLVIGVGSPAGTSGAVGVGGVPSGPTGAGKRALGRSSPASGGASGTTGSATARLLPTLGV